MTPSPPGAHAATAPETTGSAGISVVCGVSAEHQERLTCCRPCRVVAASHLQKADFRLN